MIITCEQCQARFRLADDKLKAGGTKVRCSKCQHIFTVLPPAAPPAEEVVDFGDFNMERVSDEVPGTAPQPTGTTADTAQTPQSPTGSAADAGDLDFSSLEQASGAGGGGGEFTEEFTFADTTSSAAAAPDDAGESPAATGFGELEFSAGEASAPSGPADFAFEPADSTEKTSTLFGELELSGEEAPSPSEPADFASEPIGSEEQTTALFGERELSGEDIPAQPETTEFAPAPAEPAVETFSPPERSWDEQAGEFNFAAESGQGGESHASDESPESVDEPGNAGFVFAEQADVSPFDIESAPADEKEGAWDQSGKSEGFSFDFDEPSFESKAGTPQRSDGAGLSFGEIDFPGASQQSATSPFEPRAEAGFGQAAPVRTAEPEPAAQPSPPPGSSRPAAGRPRGSDAPLAAAPPPSKSPVSLILTGLVVLLLALCAAGGYFYFMGDGPQMIERLLMQVKGEQPAAPVEQRIGLNITGSSYVNNREAGQLLVLQGEATNNFTGVRSAITVKGLLLNAAGKILQQQTVFCGNYLSEEKLKTMKYAQIEEAMNNQFGDSLTNMNVKPGVTIRFTIVFRNIPKELANINVEVVDSKAGGL